MSESLIPAITTRWSPYRFEAREIEDDKLRSCLDAARWAASSYNDQPWYFIVARRSDAAGFDAALSCLLEANREWASNAGALLLTAIRTHFRRGGKPNRVALHDLGAAAANLVLQASAVGLQGHQMAGVNLSQMRLNYAIPEGYEPQTAIALGYVDTSAPAADDELAKRDAGTRDRLPFEEFVFQSRWGNAAPLGD